jgi:hypothetical protein
MKKIILSSILILMLATSLIKNSTKEIEDQIFLVDENIRSLKTKLSDTVLEYNYLSSPEKLSQYQKQYFKNDLIKIDITKIKKITTKKNKLAITNFVEKTPANE